MPSALKPPGARMTTDFPTAPLAPGLRGAGGGAVEKSLPASHTEILTLPAQERKPLFRYAPQGFPLLQKQDQHQQKIPKQRQHGGSAVQLRAKSNVQLKPSELLS